MNYASVFQKIFAKNYFTRSVRKNNANFSCKYGKLYLPLPTETITTNDMARIDWSKVCDEIAKANGIEIFNVTYRRHGEIKTGKVSKQQIEMFPRFGIELISIQDK